MSDNTPNLTTFYNSLKDTALFYNHQFFITFEGDVNDFFVGIDPGSFSMYVKSSKVPKVDMTEVTVNFLSQKFVLPGGVKYDSSWDVTLVLDNDFKVYDNVLAWQEQYASLAKNGGGTHRIPHINAHVHCLDASMSKEVSDFVLEGVFPTKLPKLSMQYENDSKPHDVSFTFAYQAMYYKSEAGHSDVEPDPLL